MSGVLDTPLELWADALEGALGPQRPVRVYRDTASTQDRARELIDAEGHRARGAVVVAGHQTAGRGRLGRTWVSPPGACLTFSVVAPHDPAAPERPAYAAAVALARALDHWLTPAGWPASIKLSLIHI